ncbi:MAG: CBS domain-containing protein [Candidatus Odinarchaeia archaeon]
MQVKDIMSKNPKVIDKDGRVSEAFEIMDKKNISQLIVIDYSKPIGIISDWEIMDRLGSSKLGNLSAASIHVSGLMREEDTTVTPDETVSNAAKLMLQKDLSALSVVDDKGIIGVVSHFDMIKPCTRISNVKIHHIVFSNVPLLKPEDRVINARRVILEGKLTGVPVVSNGQLVGLLTQRMIAKAMVAFRDVVPQKHQDARIKHLIVQDIMLQDPPVFDPEAEISEAAKFMLNGLYRCAPIVNQDNQIVGILTSKNFAEFAAKNFTI